MFEGGRGEGGGENVVLFWGAWVFGCFCACEERSDLELEYNPKRFPRCVCVCHSHLHRYPLADNPEEFLPVATTRPETILGDTAVAVHPEDERYKVRRAACCPRASYKGRV